jgi:hypothetical protein
MRLYFGRDAMNTDMGCTLMYSRETLPEITTAADAICFGLARGFSITDRGRDKAYEYGILSDDSPAVPIPPDKRKPLKADASTETDETPDTGNAGGIVETVDTAKAGGLNIADTIGATAWGEIRLAIRPGDGDKATGGITFHHGQKYKAYSWKNMGLHNADELQGVLMMLARDGAINWGKRLDTKRRDFDARRAREQAAGNMRGRVNKLNTKFLKHFPAAWGNPFFNDDGVTKHHFQKIEMQRTS